MNITDLAVQMTMGQLRKLPVPKRPVRGQSDYSRLLAPGNPRLQQHIIELEYRCERGDRTACRELAQRLQEKAPGRNTQPGNLIAGEGSALPPPKGR